MKRISNLFCKVGMHDRSAGRARLKHGTWVSRCRKCDVPMQRTPGGKWVVIKPEEQSAPGPTTLMVAAVR